MAFSSESSKPKRRRTRPKRKGNEKDTAKNVVAPIRSLSPSKPSLRDKAADDPLSPAEAQEMKEHFRFLREHRKLLKLRLNAAEDLLLNGVREPTHRGVCQHLLVKVERDRVLAVSERLPPAQAAKLLAGVLRFAPEVSYVLRYLECVSDANSQEQAAAALAHALRRIQFSETSNAQMRQILSLIVSVFPSTELPVLIFNWLFNTEFRKALDRSSDVLPDALAAHVLPLRAAHKVLTRDESRASQRQPVVLDSTLLAGVRLLLSAPKATLAELPSGVRRRLLDYALHLRLEQPREPQGLIQVYKSLRWQKSAERGEMGLRLAGALLQAHLENEAKDLLRQELSEGETAAQAKRWLRMLRGPRLGPVALEVRGAERSRRDSDSESDLPAGERFLPDRWQRGFHVPTQERVRIRYGAAEQRQHFAEQAALWQSVLLPGVARLLVQGTDGERPFVVVRLMGQGLLSAVRSGFDPQLRCKVGLELCAILNATALSGVCLPDAHAGRFSMDHGSRVWLVDLWGVQPSRPDAAVSKHAMLAGSLLHQLFKEHPEFERLNPDLTFTDLVSVLESSFGCS